MITAMEARAQVIEHSYSDEAPFYVALLSIKGAIENASYRDGKSEVSHFMGDNVTKRHLSLQKYFEALGYVVKFNNNNLGIKSEIVISW